MLRTAILIVLLVVLIVPSVSADDPLEIYVKRYVENGRMLIEMRAIFEWLGWTVEWVPGEQGIVASGEGYHLAMWVNDQTAFVNGAEYWLDVPPRLHWGKTYVPLRFVAEATGCQVDYYGDAVQIIDEGNVLNIYIVD